MILIYTLHNTFTYRKNIKIVLKSYIHTHTHIYIYSGAKKYTYDEVYLWWKLQASLIFLSGRTCTIGGWLNTFLPHCIYIYIHDDLFVIITIITEVVYISVVI